MVSSAAILKITCPKCGARPGAPCFVGGKGKLRPVQHPQRIGRAIDERDFWRWVDQQLAAPENANLTEQQILDRISQPEFAGRKARNAHLAQV